MGKISSVRDRISQAPEWSVCVWKAPVGKQKSPAVLERGEDRQDAWSDARTPAGRGLGAASRKPSCNSRNQGGIQLLTRTKVITQSLIGSSAAWGKKKTFPILCCSDFFSRASHRSWPQRHHTLPWKVVVVVAAARERGPSTLCVCTGKAPKPSPSAHQEHSHL